VAWRGVTVDAPPKEVWPWFAQIRLAPYSYDWIDNLGRRSPRELRGLPDPVVGERFTTAAGRRLGRIVSVGPGEQLTGRLGSYVMSYVLLPGASSTRRLLKVVASSGRLRAPFVCLGDLIMARRQLLANGVPADPSDLVEPPSDGAELGGQVGAEARVVNARCGLEHRGGEVCVDEALPPQGVSSPTGTLLRVTPNVSPSSSWRMISPLWFRNSRRVISRRLSHSRYSASTAQSDRNRIGGRFIPRRAPRDRWQSSTPPRTLPRCQPRHTHAPAIPPDQFSAPTATAAATFDRISSGSREEPRHQNRDLRRSSSRAPSRQRTPSSA
jgi:hypothetical protein